MNPLASLTTVQEELRDILRQTLQKVGLPNQEATVTIASDLRFGDYQSNIAMILAKQEKQPPRRIAQRIVEGWPLSGPTEPPEIAGAGFINFRLCPTYLQKKFQQLLNDPRLGIPLAKEKKKIVIDFSSPNVAKPMHVGHIRSTFLGDSLARIARFMGHEVITDNHLGDWGTQFGKVIYGWKHFLDQEALQKNPISELVRLYRQVHYLEENDPHLKQAVREELVQLQQGDPTNTAIWKEVIELSWKAFTKIYQLLGIEFDEHLGESAYRHELDPLVEQLLASGIAKKSEGAVVIFFNQDSSLAEHPYLIRKSDGASLYATTDIATLLYRQERWDPDEIWYVCGIPQQLHFKQLFAVAHKLGLRAKLTHIDFGSILGEDRKMMKTRSGEPVELASLLKEAIERAAAVVRNKNPHFSPEEIDQVAHIVGLGALKYVDLMQHRLTDYLFSWEKMLSFQGNTAPYLQNAYVRIASILRKAPQFDETQTSLLLNEEIERTLLIKLLQFAEIIPAVLIEGRPNLLATALYELANHFHRFYEQCPILQSSKKLQQSRLTLASLISKMLSLGLNLLGISVPHKM